MCSVVVVCRVTVSGMLAHLIRQLVIIEVVIFVLLDQPPPSSTHFPSPPVVRPRIGRERGRERKKETDRQTDRERGREGEVKRDRDTKRWLAVSPDTLTQTERHQSSQIINNELKLLNGATCQGQGLRFVHSQSNVSMREGLTACVFALCLTANTLTPVSWSLFPNHKKNKFLHIRSIIMRLTSSKHTAYVLELRMQDIWRSVLCNLHMHISWNDYQVSRHFLYRPGETATFPRIYLRKRNVCMCFTP